MAIDRETIVSSIKKVRVIRPLQKSFKVCVKRFGKWSRSSGRQARHPITGLGQKENSSNQANG